jgi:undecaprenyl-diphosphatase
MSATGAAIQPAQAVLLGLVEGLTEFLPVSSTGHLILAARCLRLSGEAVKTFEIIIQAGALAAVLGLYRVRVVSMVRGLLGADAAGRALVLRLAVSFLPSAVAGLLLHRVIKARLFSTWPVVAALAAGGLAMIVVDRWCARRGPSSTKTLETVTLREALLVGLAQCLSLWPGTSRAMVTIVAGLLLGWPATVAAEYSFLLALPTLGAATAFDALRGGPELLREAGGLSIACGFVTAAVVAAAAIRGFIRYLTHRGLAPFGWYRVGLSAAVWILGRQP